MAERPPRTLPPSAAEQIFINKFLGKNMKKFDLKIIKDYPKPGINFIDINPLLQNPAQFARAIEEFCAQIPAEELRRAAIIAPEARGFLFATPVAYKLGLPLLLIRKHGKIPNAPYAFRITNEYSTYNMEVDGELLNRYNRFIYIDDILATGQTLASVRQALQAREKDIVLAIHFTAVEDLKPMRESNPVLIGLPSKIIYK